jgi:uncharacterized protein YybS (DUF2232 family)
VHFLQPAAKTNLRMMSIAGLSLIFLYTNAAAAAAAAAAVLCVLTTPQPRPTSCMI